MEVTCQSDTRDTTSAWNVEEVRDSRRECNSIIPCSPSISFGFTTKIFCAPFCLCNPSLLPLVISFILFLYYRLLELQESWKNPVILHHPWKLLEFYLTPQKSLKSSNSPGKSLKFENILAKWPSYVDL